MKKENEKNQERNNISSMFEVHAKSNGSRFFFWGKVFGTRMTVFSLTIKKFSHGGFSQRKEKLRIANM